MRFLLDTCVISDFFKKNANTIQALQIQPPSILGIATISVMEIEFGLAINPERALKLRPLWSGLMRQINIISFDNEDAKAAATVRAYLRKKANPIGAYDTLLAGTALSRGLIFVTSNKTEFNRVPNLVIEDWREKQSTACTLET